MRYHDTLCMSDGVELAYTRFEVPRPRAVIVGCHGLGEHAGRYQAVAEAWTRRGYAFRMMDWRGHGHSPGKRGHSPYARAIEDLIDLTRACEREGLPLILFGHSFGGGLALHVLLTQPLSFRGAIVTSPWLRLKKGYGKAAMGVLGVAASLMPGLTISNGLQSLGLCHDLEKCKAYDADPLIHDRISLSMAIGAMRAGEHAIEHAGELSVPLLLAHGESDPICDVQGTRDFAQGAGEKCVYVEFPGMLHELHNEEVWSGMFEREAAFADGLTRGA